MTGAVRVRVGRPAGVLVLLAILPVATGCGVDDAAGGEGTRDTTLTVLAAASLTESFTELAAGFEADHPGVRVRLAFDSSAALAQQALEGAPGDVLATADIATMDAAAAALEAEPESFATNSIVLVTPADNPAGIARVGDLDAEEVDYVVCVETAPCGTVARRLLSANAIRRPPASLEVDVKAVLARVTEGEADAGLVYATDAEAAGPQVDTVDVPGAAAAVTTYPIATLTQAREPDLAREFVGLVLSDQGQRVLSDAGFGAPLPERPRSQVPPVTGAAS